jgi:transcription initiation factor IIE alpha subunit
VPISSDRFDEIGDTNDSSLSPETNAAKVLAFLRTHRNKAFTQSEIADETDVKRGSIGPTLVRLRETGRVDHRGHYWRISDHEESVETATGHTSTTLSVRESHEETPQMKEWKDNAVDPRTHRDE